MNKYNLFQLSYNNLCLINHGDKQKCCSSKNDEFSHLRFAFPSLQKSKTNNAIGPVQTHKLLVHKSIDNIRIGNHRMQASEDK